MHETETKGQKIIDWQTRDTYKQLFMALVHFIDIAQ
jgi:hypothetical protein